jgi:hypothetical protein
VPGSTVSFAMPAQVLTGLLATSLANGTAASATLSAVAIGAISNTPAPYPPADPCPTGWTCTDVGNPAITGTQTLANGVWNIQGAGTGIIAFQYSEQFHYVEQAISTDTTLSARVVSQSLTAGNAASGLMIRANTNGNAAFYAAIVVPGTGLVVLYRPFNGLRSFQLVSRAITSRPTPPLTA